MRRRSLATALTGGAALAVLAQACESPTAAEVSLLTVVVGDSQTGIVSLPLPTPIGVRAENPSGEGIEGIVVQFTMSPPGGFTPASDTTDRDGIASTIATLGRRAGPVTIAAKLADLPETTVRLAATALPGPPARLLKESGDLQADVSGATLAEPLAVRVEDQYSNNVPNVPLLWSVMRGGGSFVSTPAPSDSAGVSRGAFTLGATFGETIVSAMIPGLDTVSFSLLTGARVTDPTGDTFNGAQGYLSADVADLFVASDERNLLVRLDFAQQMAYGGTGETNELGGYIDIDIDQDSTTGIRPFTDEFRNTGGSTGMGTDYFVATFARGDTTYEVWSTAQMVGTVRAEFVGAALVLRIPLSLLGGDEGNVNVAVVMGSSVAPNDVAPDQGHMSFINPQATAAPVTTTTGARESPPRTQSLRWGQKRR